MTFLGIVFIPLILICFVWRPFYLLPLLIVASVFEAGSLFGGALGDFEFGISPFYLAEIFIFLRLAILVFQSDRLLPSKNTSSRGIVVVLCAFWAWCFASAFVMPHLFAGTLVPAQRAERDEFAPVQWTLSNLAQAGYLTLNVGTIVYAVHVVRTLRQADAVMKALYWAVFIVVVIGFAQFVAVHTGLDFPYEAFNNNPAYAHGTSQELGAVVRTNLTFTEPSTAGSYLSAITCGLLAGFFAGKRSVLWILAILGCTTVLFFTTSSTGFASLAVGLCLLMLYLKFFRRHKPVGKSSPFHWIALLSIIGIVGFVLWVTPDLLDAVLAMTIEKGESYSFWFRLAEELHSFGVFLSTYGLGVGLGSTRSSGLLTTMLSSVGIIGTGLFVYLLYRITKWFLRSPATRSLQMAFWALLTLAISGILGVPDLNRPAFWALLVVVLSQLNVLASHPPLQFAQDSGLSRSRSPLQRPPSVVPAI